MTDTTMQSHATIISEREFDPFVARTPMRGDKDEDRTLDHDQAAICCAYGGQESKRSGYCLCDMERAGARL
jgi:hypothetical protein